MTIVSLCYAIYSLFTLLAMTDHVERQRLTLLTGYCSLLYCRLLPDATWQLKIYVIFLQSVTKNVCAVRSVSVSGGGRGWIKKFAAPKKNFLREMGQNGSFDTKGCRPLAYVVLRLFWPCPSVIAKGSGHSLFCPGLKMNWGRKCHKNASRHFLSWQLRATLPMHWTLMISWRILHGTEPGKNAFHRWNALLSINVRNCSYWVALSRFYLWLKAVHSKFVQIAKNCINYNFFYPVFVK